MMFAALDAMDGGMRKPNYFGKCRVRKVAPFFFQKLCELAIQIALHNQRLAENS